MSFDRRAFIASGAAAAGILTAGRAGAADLAPFNITVTHYPAQDYALPAVVAQDLGYMRAEGIDLKSIVGSSGGGTTVRNIAQGGLLLAEVSTAAAIKAILAGENLKIIACGTQTPGSIAWCAKRGSPVKSIADLVGKTVGFTQPGSVSETLLGLSLKAAGVDPTKVTMKAAGGLGENYTLLQTGGLDAAFIVDPVLTTKSRDLQLLFFARHYVPRFLQTVWLVDSGVFKEQGAKIAGFLRARAKGVELTSKDPRHAAEIWARVTSQSEREAAFTLRNERPGEYFSNGALDPKGLALVVEGMRTSKQLGPEKVALEKIVDQSALPASMRTAMTGAV